MSALRILVLGATGFVGGAVAQHLLAAGHDVHGLARDDAAVATLTGHGVKVVRGDLQGRFPDVAAAARSADVVVYAAQPPSDVELATVDALAGPGLLFLSGSGVLLERTAGAFSENSFAEADEFVVEPLARARLEAEDRVRAAGGRVVRPGLIWGPGDHGHIPMVYRSVAVTGSACYVGSGLNVYGHVHVQDVARLVELVLDRGRPGALYHAVTGETPNRWIAERVAADLGCPVRSVDAAEAARIWGEFGALVLGASSRTRAPRSRDELGWVPVHLDMLEEVGEPRMRELAASAGPGVGTG